MADETHRRYHSGRFGVDSTTPAPTTPQGPDRPVDVLAGKGSLADTLRLRRKAIEGGDPSGGQGEGY